MNLSRRKFIQNATLGTVALAVPLFSGCNQNEPTAPPPLISTIPNPPSNLQVVEMLRAVMLIWDAPQFNTDGSMLIDLQSYQIYRKTFPDGEFEYLFEVNKSGTIFIDTGIGKNEVAYQVVAKTNRGALSVPSESSLVAKARLKIRSVDVPTIGTRSLFETQGNRVTEPTAASVSVERLSENEFLSLELVCTHAGCGGMNLNDETWICRCHGSRFDSQGNVVQSPATSPLFRLRNSLSPNGDLFLSVS